MSISSVVRDLRTKLEELEAEVDLLNRTISCPQRKPFKTRPGTTMRTASSGNIQAKVVRGAGRPKGEGPRQQQVKDYLMAEGIGLSASTIARDLKICKPTVYHVLNSGVRDGWAAKMGKFYYPNKPRK